MESTSKRDDGAMNINSVRDLFPIVQRFLYFDAASLSPYSTPIIETLARFDSQRMEYGALNFDLWGEEIEDCRLLAARLIRSKKAEIAFIKNTSEGVNLTSQLLDWKKRDNVIVSRLDFPTNIYPFLNLKKKGVEVRYVKDRQGRVLSSDIEDCIDKKTKLVSLSSVIYSNGFRLDIEEIGKICKEKEIFFHVNATQSLGVLRMNVRKSNIDFLSATGYKWLLSPLGSGLFFIREELLDGSPVLGWHSVKDPLSFNTFNYTLLDSAKRFEPGTLDVSAFLGMHAALILIHSVGIEKIERYVTNLSHLLIEELNNKGLDLLTNFEKKNISGIVTIKNKGLTKNDLIKKSIIATVRRDYIRLSPHVYNNEDDVFKVVDIL